MADILFDAEKTKHEVILFLQKSLQQSPFNKYLIGLSGGLDSAVSASLLVESIGSDNVVTAVLPYGSLNSKGFVLAKQLEEKLQIPSGNQIVIDIQSICDQIFSHDETMDQIRKGNVMARVRMTLLFDLAKKHKALVCGTENKSEHLLGYFTRFGDEASDIEPIRSLYKTQVQALAVSLGLPKEIQEVAPTAGLWEGQTDENELGFSYEIADQVLHLVYDQKKTIEEAVKLGFDKEVVEMIIKQVEITAFKHHLPLTP